MIDVIGSGGHAKAVAALLDAPMVPIEQYKKRRGDGRFAVVGIGCSEPGMRRALFRRIGGRIAHLVRIDTRVGTGTVVFPHCTFGVDTRLGANVVVYSNSVIEHGSTVGDHAWLSPGVILCGNVRVGVSAFLGAGSIVLPGVTIGDGARIGAGCVIHDDVADGVTVYGPRDAAAKGLTVKDLVRSLSRLPKPDEPRIEMRDEDR